MSLPPINNHMQINIVEIKEQQNIVLPTLEKKRRGGWWETSQETSLRVKQLLRENATKQEELKIWDSQDEDALKNAIDTKDIKELDSLAKNTIDTKDIKELDSLAPAAEEPKIKKPIRRRKKQRPPFNNSLYAIDENVGTPHPVRNGKNLEPIILNSHTDIKEPRILANEQGKHQYNSRTSNNEDILIRLTDQKLYKTAQTLVFEAKIPNGLYILLNHMMKTRDFVGAMLLADFVKTDQVCWTDLIYLLGKFSVICFCQCNDFKLAQSTLNKLIDLTKSDQERSEWFNNDFLQLKLLINNESDSIYSKFDFDSEIENFWDSLNMDPRPLFSYALESHFKPVLKPRPPSKPPSVQRPRFTAESGPLKSAENETGDRESTSRKSRKKWSSEISDQTKPESFPSSSDVHENANFALASLAGPSIGEIRVLAITCDPTSGQIIAATSGGETRADKCICIWDLRGDCLITSLDNQTVKPITQLCFHPSFPELLLTADMSCDVKLWNWKEGKVVKYWKRHHSRIIFQIGFVPGDDTKGISCSGDQSVKLWNIHADKTHGGSVHANEPITGFTFCGNETDQMQMKLAISLSSSIRIYKLRTLQLLFVVGLKDVKPTNIPLNHIQCHPIHENYILISSDHQLRLYDLSTEKVVKVYNSRNINSSTRIRGNFSPCGNYVYAANCDARIGSRATDSNDSILIWKTSTAKLEYSDMQQFSSTGDHNGVPLEKPIASCVW